MTSDTAVLSAADASPSAAASARRRSPLTWVPSLYFAQGLPFFAVNLIPDTTGPIKVGEDLEVLD